MIGTGIVAIGETTVAGAITATATTDAAVAIATVGNTVDLVMYREGPLASGCCFGPLAVATYWHAAC